MLTKVFSMIKYLIFFSVCLASNPVDEWIDRHVNILENNIKSVSFQFSIYSELFNIAEDSVIISKIIVGKKNQFRISLKVTGFEREWQSQG